MYNIIILSGLLLTLFVAEHAAIRVHCRHMESIHEDHIHHCCQHPDGHNEITEKCAKEHNFQLPGRDEEAIEDVTVDQAMMGSCWAKCVFDNYRFIKNGSLDMDAVHTYYKTVHKLDPEYETEMLDAFTNCHGKTEAATAKFLAMPFVKVFSTANYCDPMPSIILSCVIYRFFHNCPRSRWSNSTECVETLAFAKKCKDVLTTM